MQKINDLSRIQEARLDADSLNMPLPHILPANPSLFTHKTYSFSFNACMFPFWRLGRALILYLCKSKGKKLTFKK